MNPATAQSYPEVSVFSFGYCSHAYLYVSGSKMKEKMTAKNVNENLGNTVTFIIVNFLTEKKIFKPK